MTTKSTDLLIQEMQYNNSLLEALLKQSGSFAFTTVSPLAEALAAAAPGALAHAYTPAQVGDIIIRLIENYTPLRPIERWYVLGNLGIPLHLLARDINITFHLSPEKQLGPNSIQSTWTVGVLIAVVYGILTH